MSLPDYLSSYRSFHPEDVMLVEDEISIDYEPTAYYKQFERENPLLWFKNIRGYPDFELAANILGKNQRLAFAIGSPVEKLFDSWNDLVSYFSELCISDSRGSVKEVVQTGNDVDLFSLPVGLHYSCDGQNTGFGKYINSGIAVARHPKNRDIINLSYTRMQLINEKRYAFNLGSRGHLWHYVQLAKESGESVPVTILVGAHPVFYMLAASFIENEYLRAPKVIRTEYVQGQLNDIPIPSETEIAIEAEIIPNEFFNEGPVAEFTGYVAHETTGNVAQVKSILRKAHPVFYDIIPSNSTELVCLSEMPRNAAISSALRNFMPSFSDYRLEWPLCSSHFMALCCVTRPLPGLAKQVGLALFGMDPLFTKIVIVNEGETELNFERLLVNLAVQGPELGNNIEIVSKVFCIKLDPAATPEGTNGRLLIVTKKSGLPYEKIVSDHLVRLVCGNSEVIISHSQTDEGRVNIILDRDIDLSDTDKIIWGLSTRLAPDKGVFIKKGRIILNATTLKNIEVASIPDEVTKRVRSRVTRSK